VVGLSLEKGWSRTKNAKKGTQVNGGAHKRNSPTNAKAEVQKNSALLWERGNTNLGGSETWGNGVPTNKKKTNG